MVSLTQLIENTEPFSKKPHRATCRDNQGGEVRCYIKTIGLVCLDAVNGSIS